MAPSLVCPVCHCKDLPLVNYDSMMVLSPDLALFSLRCPQCGHRVSALQPIPEVLRADVQCAARQVGAGMGSE